MRILLIEDDQNTAFTLKNELTKWFIVETALTGEDGENLAHLSSYDLFIIDLSLAEKTGLEVCDSLRKSGFKVPILMLTSNADVKNIVDALNLGSDDYVTKPFNFEELLARIRALLRRSPETLASNILRIGELMLDSSNKNVMRQDKTISLRKKEFYLLEYLMRNPSRVISRNMIMENVWDSNSDIIANVIDVHIKHLREKVDQPFARKMIKTIHGLGYRLDP